MIATLPELALKSTEPLLEALQSPPGTWGPDVAEDFLLMALQGQELFQRCWKRTLTDLSAGMSGQQAQLMLDGMVRLAKQRALILGLLVELAERANTGQRARATEALGEAQEIEAAAREMLDFVSQPPAPVDREDLARALEEWKRREGLDAEDMLARRKARRPA